MRTNSIYKSYLLILLLAVGLVVAACGSDDDADAETSSDTTVIEELEGITTESGLQFIEVEAGNGPKPTAGDLVQVHYTGKLLDGTEFDSSIGGDPYTFPLGAGQVISGWDEGIAMLNEGGKAMLIIPPDLAYGSAGAGGIIPPDATLMFDVELVAILKGAPDAPTEVDEGDYSETESGLKYLDIEVGDGDAPEEGDQISVHYTGWLTDGNKFDSSLDRGNPIVFALGRGQVISGWDEGLSTMQVGGKRQLLIPSELAYGETGYGAAIPPNSTLIFEVELVDIQE